MGKQPTALDYSVVTQVILLRPKAETTDQALATYFKAVHSAQPHIPCLVAVATGENQSEAHRGFTHGIFLHFDREPQEAKAHPKYQDLIARARSLCEQVVTFELPVTTSHFALLDHFVKMGQLPYKTVQWMLSNDLDLADLRAQVYEQTGKLPISPSGVSTDAPTSLEYLIYAEHKNYGVKVSFSSQVSRSPTRIRLTRDTTMDGTFYRAHELFSVRTILSILRGEIPYKQVAQLVEDACRSPEELGWEKGICS